MFLNTQSFLGTSRCKLYLVRGSRSHTSPRRTSSSVAQACIADESQQTRTVSKSRRSTLAAIVTAPLGLALTSAGPVLAEGLTSSTLAGAYVVPAMKVPAYLSRIQFARPQAWNLFQEYIDKGKYKIMAESLVLSPFDDVFQSCFYIPWALLPIDESRAASAQAAYNVFKSRTEDLNAVCIRAARYAASETEVITAMDALDASLTDFLQVVNV